MDMLRTCPQGLLFSSKSRFSSSACPEDRKRGSNRERGSRFSFEPGALGEHYGNVHGRPKVVWELLSDHGHIYIYRAQHMLIGVRGAATKKYCVF